MIVLRTFHILAGALWFGSAFLFAGFFGPAAAELGPTAGPVMSAIIKKRRIATVIAVLAITTVIVGWMLWVKNALTYASIGDWVTSSFGIVLTIGGVLATAAAYYGITGIGDEDLRPDAVVAQVDRQAELEVGVDRVHPAVLQLVGAELVEQPDPAALLRQVQQHAAALALDLRQCRLELLAAVAAQRVEDIAGQALRVHADEHVVPPRDSPLDQRDVVLVVHQRAVSRTTENSPNAVGILVSTTRSTSLSCLRR